MFQSTNVINKLQTANYYWQIIQFKIPNHDYTHHPFFIAIDSQTLKAYSIIPAVSFDLQSNAVWQFLKIGQSNINRTYLLKHHLIINI